MISNIGVVVVYAGIALLLSDLDGGRRTWFGCGVYLIGIGLIIGFGRHGL